MSVLIIPVVYELSFDAHGEIIPGPGTQRACDRALASTHSSEDASILLTAIEPPHPKWQGVTMASVCERYLRSLDPKCKIIMRRAPTFNTDGEIAALFAHLEQTGADRVEVHVKWWHTPRCMLLVRKYAAKSSWTGAVQVTPHRLPLWTDLTSIGAMVLEVPKILRTWIHVQKTRGQQ